MKRIGGLVVVLVAAACASPSPRSTPVATEDKDTVTVSFGDAEIEAEIADEHDERVLGLMNRKSLDADAGMLFVFPGNTSGGFWMKNTLIPLSIAYMGRTADGYEVLAILDMEPCRADPCPDYPPGVPYDAALETNQGWFERNGVGKGDLATLDREVESTG